MFGLFSLFFIFMLLKAELYICVPLSVFSKEKALSRLLAISFGLFYRFRTKKTFSACLQLVTLMLAYFTQNNVIVCLQLNWVALSFISRNTTFLLFCSSALSFREQRCFGHNYASSSFIAPEIVFACFQLENRFFPFSTKGCAGFGETDVQVFGDRNII